MGTQFELIADIGCNHMGSMVLAKTMISQAARAGVNAVKFQYYSTDEIIEYERAHPPSLYTEDLFRAIRSTELRIEQLEQLKEWCDEKDLEFLCTPFINPERVIDLAPLVKRWKIRERDGRNPYHNTLLEAALATKREVLVSRVSLPTPDFILNYPEIRWLFTIPQYPASLRDLSLSEVSYFDGYSNHIPTILAPLATAVSAQMRGKDRWTIEIHMAPERYFAPEKLIDHEVSFTFTHIAELVHYLHDLEQCR